MRICIGFSLPMSPMSKHRHDGAIGALLTSSFLVQKPVNR